MLTLRMYPPTPDFPNPLPFLHNPRSSLTPRPSSQPNAPLHPPIYPKNRQDPRKGRPSPYTSPSPNQSHLPSHCGRNHLPNPPFGAIHTQSITHAPIRCGQTGRRHTESRPRCGLILGSGRQSARPNQPGRTRAFVSCSEARAGEEGIGPPGSEGGRNLPPLRYLPDEIEIWCRSWMGGDDAGRWERHFWYPGLVDSLQLGSALVEEVAGSHHGMRSSQRRPRLASGGMSWTSDPRKYSVLLQGRKRVLLRAVRLG
jgi:hypothetical protein